ncbi:MAG: elongation factor P [Candidatus Lloydbacteria bacterium CG22_combo_CG10-13_8_21_14_all_47_15]|uniref:Elongation factor P n=1 Tax=Candidatus Lloydbacteria bacterium CG22_combo_CG10-13_8_21_14_all_47_15 TaxID=1974635 RepID=A0A2H0CTB4_9BACT|nr:MAG: elongation factor P [Candidatus Lloydbacteria bacterium CG22_combo_CG10-13_8_21_14_all_47_15]
MLEYNEITPKKFIVLDGDPYEVLASHVFRKQQRKPVNQTKLKNLITGKVTERSFHQAESAEEAELETRTIVYLYARNGEVWFREENNPSKRFTLPEDMVGSALRFMKENAETTALEFKGDIIGVDLPIKMDLVVTEAPPAIKGATAQGGNKQVTLETGATIAVPMFVNEGDTIRVNTDTGEYVERVGKK